MTADKIISDDGGGAAWLIGCLIDMVTMGGSLFGEPKEILAMSNGLLFDVVMGPTQIRLRKKNDIRIDRLHVVET